MMMNEVDINDKCGINDILMNKQNKIFSRFFGRSRNEPNKFTIQSVVKSHSSLNDKDYHETMMDNIYKYMCCTHDVSLDEMQKFKKYIDFEEYDTDSIVSDIEDDDVNDSDILSSNNHFSPTFCDTLYQFIKYNQRMCSIHILIYNNRSFSCGFSFFYWPHFENNATGDLRIYFKNNKYRNLKEKKVI